LLQYYKVEGKMGSICTSGYGRIALNRVINLEKSLM